MDLPSLVYIVQAGKSRKFRGLKRQIHSRGTHQIGSVECQVKYFQMFKTTQ